MVKGSVVSDTDEAYADIVRFGHKAMKLEYDWTNIERNRRRLPGPGRQSGHRRHPHRSGRVGLHPRGRSRPWLRAQIATSTDGGRAGPTPISNFSSGSEPPARD